MPYTYDNYQIHGLKDQLKNTGDFLQKKGIVIIVNDFSINYDKKAVRLSWESNVNTYYATGDDLLNIEQYLEIYKLRLFHYMLYDGSLIRFNYEFNGNKLVAHNLLWWPCPYRGFKVNNSSLEEIDLLLEVLNGQLNKSDIEMRSPIRMDYDGKNERENHPLYHLHTENCDTRIAINVPLCINGFMQFILSNFYPQEQIDFSDWDNIKLEAKKPSMQYPVTILINN